MLAALFATALIASPPQADDMTRNVVMDVCLPFVNGAGDRAAAEALGFIVASQEGAVTDLVSSDERQAYLLRLTADEAGEDEDDVDVVRTCVLQARSAGFDAARGAIRRPLEGAGFVAEPSPAANRLIWTRQGVTVSLRQNEGHAAVVRVSYSSAEAGE